MDVGHAAQAAESASAGQVEQQGLVGIVAVVGHGHGHGANFPSQLLKPIVAQVAGRHFHTDAPAAGHFGRGKTGTVEGHAEAVAQVGDKGLVAQAFVAPQVEVAVCGRDLVARLAQQEQQGYAVGPAAEGHQQVCRR